MLTNPLSSGFEVLLPVGLPKRPEHCIEVSQVAAFS